MMNRRKLITILMGAALLPAVALAQDVGAGIVAQLQAQGFTKISVETTWLGRLRIIAARADGQREIIANPRTGEILRDIWTGATGSSKAAILDQVGDKSGSGSGSSGSGSSGSGSSGSGSSGSGSSGSGSSGSGSSGSGSFGSGSSGSGSSGSGSSGSDDGGSSGGSSGSGSSGSGSSGSDDGGSGSSGSGSSGGGSSGGSAGDDKGGKGEKRDKGKDD